MKKIISKLKEKRGDGAIMSIAVCVFILAIGLFIADYMRVFTVQENVSEELRRGTNLSIKTAMYDSHRQSSVSKFDEDICEDAFYDYLVSDMGLNYVGEGKYECYKNNGELEYRLSNIDVDMNGSATRFAVKATVETKPAFFGNVFMYEFPLEIKSRNMRTDYY